MAGIGYRKFNIEADRNWERELSWNEKERIFIETELKHIEIVNSLIS
jgi:hypothetical protein